MKKNFTICLILTLTIFIHAQERADFIIIGNPHAYLILNKYQQPLTERERKKIHPFSPFQIINKKDTLGDGLTPAEKVRFCNKIYYLQKDENDNYITKKSDVYFKIFKGCKILEDSIEVTRQKAILLSEKYPSQGNKQYIAKGKLIKRLFRYQNYTYVLYKNVRESFGWCSIASRSNWKPYASLSKEDYKLTESLKSRVRAKIQSINKIYEQYFISFNKITNGLKSVPVWKCLVGSNSIKCSLSGSYKKSAQMEESTRYIVHDLENMFIGKPFEVVYKKGEIVIQLKR